jgi:hypothetical protein
MTVVDLQVDDRLARAAASAGLIGSVNAAPDRPLDDDVWDALVLVACDQRSTGNLLDAIECGDWPATDAQRTRLLERQTRLVGQSLLLERTLLGVTHDFDAHDVRHRVLKGAAVAHLDYAHAGQRSFGDIDLLVRSEDVDRVAGIVDGRRTEPPARPGFDRRFGKSSTYMLPNGHEIDVHRTLVMGPFGLSVDLSDLWGPGQEFMLAGRRLTALPTESRMLHAAYSCVLSDWPPRSHPRRDLAEMVLFGEYDSTEVIDMARRWQAEVVLAVALTETWEYLGLADVTALSAWAARYHVTGRDERLLAMYRREDAPYAKLALSSLPMLEGWGARATFTRSLALPDKEFLRHRRASLPSYLWRGTRRALRRTGR